MFLSPIPSSITNLAHRDPVLNKLSGLIFSVVLPNEESSLTTSLRLDFINKCTGIRNFVRVHGGGGKKFYKTIPIKT